MLILTYANGILISIKSLMLLHIQMDDKWKGEKKNQPKKCLIGAEPQWATRIASTWYSLINLTNHIFPFFPPQCPYEVTNICHYRTIDNNNNNNNVNNFNVKNTIFCLFIHFNRYKNTHHTKRQNWSFANISLCEK